MSRRGCMGVGSPGRQGGVAMSYWQGIGSSWYGLKGNGCGISGLSRSRPGLDCFQPFRSEGVMVVETRNCIGYRDPDFSAGFVRQETPIRRPSTPDTAFTWAGSLWWIPS